MSESFSFVEPETVVVVGGSDIVEDTSGERSAGFLTGLLLGGLIGVTVAMIVAPQAGDDTREVVRARAREASDNVRTAADDLSKTAQATADDVAASANELLVRGKQIVEEARARFDASVAEGKDAAAQQRSTLEKET